MDSDIIPELESNKTMKDEAEQAVARLHTTTSNEMKSSTQETEEMRRIRQMRVFVERKDAFSKVIAIYK